MNVKYPEKGDNILKKATLVMVCKNKGCTRVLTIEDTTKKGIVVYCPEHGKRKFDQRDWLDITGSTMLEFKQVGLRPEPTRLTDVSL